MALTLYEPLSPAENQIRLLDLFSGARDDPIRGELRILSLDDDPEYEVGVPLFSSYRFAVVYIIRLFHIAGALQTTP